MKVICFDTRVSINDDESKKIRGVIQRFNVFNAEQIIELPEKYYARSEINRNYNTKSDLQLDKFFMSIGTIIKRDNLMKFNDCFTVH
ncbi:MAG: hypothetical protein OXC62_07290 [Aestuariivita sp.]|nr:hypothetical protein [Aestuariivita sp.]